MDAEDYKMILAIDIILGSCCNGSMDVAEASYGVLFDINVLAELSRLQLLTRLQGD